jgi:hypothetical protein
MNTMFAQAVSGGSGMFGAVGGLLTVVLGLATFAFWLWMLIDALTNKGLVGTEKIVWVLVVILLPCVGSLIYFFVGRPKAGR